MKVRESRLPRPRRAVNRLALIVVLLLLNLGGLSKAAAQTTSVSVSCDPAELVSALDSANDSSQETVLELAPGCVYTLASYANTNMGNNAFASIYGQIVIEGNGATIERSSAVDTPAFRFFHILQAGQLILSNVTLRNGYIDIEDTFNGGGAILNWGTAELVNVTIMENAAARGGGIFNGNGTGNLSVVDGVISDNSATHRGGGIYNQGCEHWFCNSSVMLMRTAITNNIASSQSDWGMLGIGGGIDNSEATLLIIDSAISNNQSIGGAGISSFGSTSVVTINGSVIHDNIEPISAPVSSGGSGIFIEYSALNVSETSIWNNHGGGVRNFYGTVTIAGSHIHDNQAGWFLWWGGGGLYNNSGTVHIANSTISGNSAQERGAGIYNYAESATATVDIVNSTITANAAPSGGGIYNEDLFGNLAVVTLTNTIVAEQSQGGDCAGPVLVETQGHNLDSDGSCALGPGGDISAGNAALRPPADNGGPTLTYALLPGSDAIDAGDNTYCLATDQRGRGRPSDGDQDGTATCDIGAYEDQTERVTQTASAGGTVSTGTGGASATDPVETAVTSPIGGEIQIEEVDGDTNGVPPSSFALLGQQINITAPPATASDPLVIVFELATSEIPANQNEATIQIFRNGIQVANCSSTSPIAPDPCVSQRASLPNGNAQFTVLTSAASTWSFGVLSNSPPVVRDNSYNTLENSTLIVPAPGVLGNDTDTDGDTLTAIVDTGPLSGALVLNPDGSMTYTPNSSFVGIDSFRYRAFDGIAYSELGTVIITVTPANQPPPVAVDSAVTTAEDTPVAVTLSASDGYGDPLTYSVLTLPVNGNLSGNAPNLTYTPAPNFHGSDSFTFEVDDGSVDSNVVATVTITVNPVNDAPAAGNDGYATDEDTLLTVAAPGVLGNDSDIDGDALTAVLDGGVANGSLALNADGSFTYTPNANFNGADSFTYHVNDGTLDSNIATVSITVNPVNDDPTVGADTASVTVDEGQTAGNSGTVGDVDGDTVILSASVGSVTNNNDGTWSWSFGTSDGPAENQTVTISADDGNDGSATVSFSFTVNNVAPTANAGADEIVNRNDTVTVSGAWTDPAGAADNAYTWSWDLDGDAVADVSNGAANYGDSANASTSYATEGIYTLTFSVSDKDGGSHSDSLMVTVLNVPPDCSLAAPSVSELWPPNHKMVPVSILGITDAESDPIAISIDSIFQDEPVDGAGDGDTAPDGAGINTATAEVRAERAGGGNGRYYHISFSADDGHGGVCSGTVQVSVPKSQGKKGAAVDDGPLYDSTAVTASAASLGTGEAVMQPWLFLPVVSGQ